MIRTIRKIFPIWAYDKEEKWLNEMSATGLQCCGIGLCTYHFKEGDPGEYVYRLEMLDNLPSHIKSVQYIRFLEETGVEHIGSIFRWVYFRKKAGDEPFDIYSDINSRITHLNRILLLLGILVIVNLINALNMLSSWLQLGMSRALTTSILCFVFCLLSGYGFALIYFRKCKLKREKILRE